MNMTILKGAHILLGVTGSIASFKAVELASTLTQMGSQVDVILSQGAEKFITPLTFQSVTGRKAYTDTDLWGGQAHVLHVGLGHAADILVIAPCTANTLARLAHGQADNLLTITALAVQAPILLAPAMDAGMYENAATRQNVQLLKERGFLFAGPAQGRMASGLEGLGRMVEAAEIAGWIRIALAKKGKLSNRRVVVTAGGSQEPIDPVRHITNRSSGKQGYALAQAALDAGAEVILVSHPAALPVPVGAQFVQVKTAEQMLDAVLDACKDADVLIMAAAVADFKAAKVSAQKLKKRDGIPVIELEAASDVLAEIAYRRSSFKKLRVVVGFAAESQNLLDNAIEKMMKKNLNFIAANDITSGNAGFAVDTNQLTLLFADGNREKLPLSSKEEAAETIINRVIQQLE